MLGGERKSSMMVKDGRRWLAMRCDARRCMERWAPSERHTERTTRGERRTSRRARALPRSWSRRDRERARWSEPSEPMRQARRWAWSHTIRRWFSTVRHILHKHHISAGRSAESWASPQVVAVMVA
jgi:hypothetical protein